MYVCVQGGSTEETKGYVIGVSPTLAICAFLRLAFLNIIHVIASRLPLNLHMSKRTMQQ